MARMFYSQLTYADIASAFILTTLEGLGEGGVELVRSHPCISGHRDMVHNIDGIKKWIEKRP